MRKSGGPRDFDMAKKLKGRKRHIITDTEGALLALLVRGQPRLPCTRGFSSQSRVTEFYEVQVLDPFGFQSNSQSFLRETFLAGESDGTKIGHAFYAGSFQHRDETLDVGTFMAYGIDETHSSPRLKGVVGEVVLERY